VTEQARGKGIGTSLLDFVDSELARRGIVDVRIAVMAGNDGAQRLYERRGFKAAETVLYRIGMPALAGSEQVLEPDQR
jgi:ribosomal protein S18 acetylase RimI-like enzyme